MRYVFVIALLYIIFGNVLLENDLRLRMARAALQMKILNDRKYKGRKLQTDEKDVEAPSTAYDYPEFTMKNSTTPTKDEESEDPEDVTAPPIKVPSKKPSSSRPAETNKKDAFIQVVKFHSFSPKVT